MILLLVHVEETFRSHFPKGYLSKLRRACREAPLVWHATSQVNDYEPVEEIADLVRFQFPWGWGYEPEVFATAPQELKWVIPSRGHSFTWVPPELRRFSDRVSLGGGCDSECLEDMRAVLRHRKISFRERPTLIY